MKSIKFIILFTSLVFSLSGCIDKTPYIGEKMWGYWDLDCACEDYSIPGTDDIPFEYKIFITPSGGENEFRIENVHESDTNHIYYVDIHTRETFSGFAIEGEIKDTVLLVHYVYQNFECYAMGTETEP